MSGNTQARQGEEGFFGRNLLEFDVGPESAAQGGMKIAGGIDEAKPDAAQAGPPLAGKERVVIGLEPPCPMGFDVVDKNLMNVELELLDAFDVFFLFRKKGIERGFVAPGGVDAALDAELVDGADKTEAGHDD